MAIEESVANGMQIDVPTQSAKNSSDSNSDLQVENSNLLDAYQEKLDKFKEILGISTARSSSGGTSALTSKMTLKIDSSSDNSPVLNQNSDSQSSGTHSTVSSLKERLTRIKSMQSSLSSNPESSSKLLRGDVNEAFSQQ